jgi:CRP-like cAMP-binding protein
MLRAPEHAPMSNPPGHRPRPLMQPPPQIEAAALWLSRLDPGHELSADDRKQVLAAFSTIQRVQPRISLREEGEPSFDPFLLVEGMAGRVRLMASGRRQILAFFVPGDICDVDDPFDPAVRQSIFAFSACRIAFLPRQTLLDLKLFSPGLAQAVRNVELEQHRTTQEWLVNLGTRSAPARLAHLFCELLERLERVGLVRNSAYELPLTQQDLADALGLSVVYVNRVLQGFRRDQVLTMSGRILHVLDLERLRQIGEFHAGTFVGGAPPGGHPADKNQ